MKTSNKLGWMEMGGDIKITKDFLIKNVPVDLIKAIKLYAVENDITMSEALVKVIDQKKIANS